MENTGVAIIRELVDCELDLVAGGGGTHPFANININVDLPPITIQTGVGIGVQANVAVFSKDFSQGGDITVLVGNLTIV